MGILETLYQVKGGRHKRSRTVCNSMSKWMRGNREDIKEMIKILITIKMFYNLISLVLNYE